MLPSPRRLTGTGGFGPGHGSQDPDWPAKSWAAAQRRLGAVVNVTASDAGARELSHGGASAERLRFGHDLPAGSVTG